MLRIFTNVTFGVVSVLVPLNGLSVSLTDVVHTTLLVAQSATAFVLAVIAKHGVTFLVKGLSRFLLKLTVIHLVRLYIAMHPGITNPQVEKYRDKLVTRVRERLMSVHGVRRVMTVFAIVSAAATVYTLLLLVGAVNIVYELLGRHITGLVARSWHKVHFLAPKITILFIYQALEV